ncbi:hypothetical protein IU501_07290 [Nocardia otitidiscaviarum]|uniref:hypothetical protein n=1 Tax=Nocardia otitidiscaviarum TaxID=1823 RepID=UPI001894AC84|nr:hypothetical protein [Nocardia otitidiscaviarum]MBF6132806.1 hypothetical protein [Nocardia otitidiscaviarum]
MSHTDVPMPPSSDLLALLVALERSTATDLTKLNRLYEAVRGIGADVRPDARLLAACDQLRLNAVDPDSGPQEPVDASAALSDEIVTQLRPSLRGEIPRVVDAVHEHFESMGGANDAPTLGATLAMLGVILPKRIDQRIALVEAACAQLAADPATTIVRGAPHWLAAEDEQYPMYGHHDYMAARRGPTRVVG